MTVAGLRAPGRPLLDAVDDDCRFAEVSFGMSGRMRQWHEHLAAGPFALPHVVFHDRVAAGAPVSGGDTW